MAEKGFCRSKTSRICTTISRRVFSAQDGVRQKLKICPELPGNKLSESVLKILLSVALTCKDNKNKVNFLKLQQYSLPREGHIWVPLFNFFTHLI